MEKQKIVLGSESFKFGERLRSRSVPMFPLKHCGRSKFADKKVKSNLNPSGRYPVHTNSSLRSAVLVERSSKFEIPRYRQVNYANAKPKTDTRANPKYGTGTTSSAATCKYSKTNAIASNISLPLSSKKHQDDTRSSKLSHIKSKVDTSDPAPWIHTDRRMLEEMAQLDGFMLNPRFRGIVESKSFDSVQEILEILDMEGEGPIIRIPLKRQQPDPPIEKDEGDTSTVSVQNNEALRGNLQEENKEENKEDLLINVQNTDTNGLEDPGSMDGEVQELAIPVQ